MYLLLIVCIELRPEGRLLHVEDVDEAFLTACGQEADLLACRAPVAPPDRLHGGLRRNRQLHLWFALLGRPDADERLVAAAREPALHRVPLDLLDAV